MVTGYYFMHTSRFNIKKPQENGRMKVKLMKIAELVPALLKYYFIISCPGSV
jgi:hypothetical protein